MPTLYKSRDERIQDVMLAYTKLENSIRYSLTHGGRYLPYEANEMEMMLEDKAWAMARLVIDKIMRLPNIRIP
jgi:hypothetical protein